MPDRRRTAPRIWRRTSARIGPGDRGRAITEREPIEVELWESTQRAYLRSIGPRGELLGELSAGRYYLREQDQVNRHQVLRTGFGTQQGLEVVRGAMPSQPSGQRARAAVTDTLGVTIELRALATVEAAEPRISHPRAYSWELYAHRELSYLAAVLGVDLPAAPVGARLEAAFLYGSAWLDGLRAHVVWASPELGELELVVSDTAPGTEHIGAGGGVSLTGPVRSLDIRSEVPGHADQLAGAIPIDQIASVRVPMPRCEMPSGRIVPTFQQQLEA